MDLPENALNNQRRENEATSDSNKTVSSDIKLPAQTSYASFISNQSHIEEISVRRQRAGVYTNSAEALNKVIPELANSLQHSGLLQLPSHSASLLSTDSLNIQRLTTEEIDANLIIDEKNSSVLSNASRDLTANAPVTIHQHTHVSANVAVITSPKSKIDVAALTTQLKNYYQEYDNKIKRIFGQPLDLDKCFVNLAIVKNEEQKQNEKDKLKPKQYRSQIYSSYEDIYSTKEKEVILLQDLFKERNNKIPNRIAVIGRAGIGKSILSQYLSSYLWSVMNTWQDKFDVVIKIQLRNLTKEHYNKNPSLADIICIECTDSSGTTAKVEQAEIEAILKVTSSRTLVILDGWDEFNLKESPCAKTILDLIKNPSISIIISSRPYTNLNTKDFDLLIECIGFTTENIPEYINRVCEDKSQVPLIISFLKRNPAMHSLAHVPIILDMICAVWDEEMSKHTEPMTMTELYNKMIAKLWKTFMEKLEEQNSGIDSDKLQQKKEKAKEFLSLLAFMGMESNSILLSYQQIEKAIKIVYHCSDEDVETKLKEVLAAGFLNTSDNKHLRGDYYFPHLTIQEYFASQHWVKLFDSKINIEKDIARSFLLNNKYDLRYELFWIFATGMLKLKAETNTEGFIKINQFFHILLDEPKGLIDWNELLLLMRFVEEIKTKFTDKIGESLLLSIKKWFKILIYSKKDSILSREMLVRLSKNLAHCPNILFNEAVWGLIINALSRRDSQIRFNALQFVFHLKMTDLKADIKLLLNECLHDDDISVQIAVVNIIGDHPTLIEKNEQYLLSQLETAPDNIKITVINILSKLPGNKYKHHILMFLKKNNEFSNKIIDVLLFRRDWVEESQENLINCFSNNMDINRKIFDLLESIPQLSNTSQQKIMQLMYKINIGTPNEIKWSLTHLLAKQPILFELDRLEASLRHLIGEDSSHSEEKSFFSLEIAYLLSYRKELANKLFDIAVRMINHTDYRFRLTAIILLIGWCSTGLEQAYEDIIIDKLNDTQADVKCILLDCLTTKPSLLEKYNNKILFLLNDENEGVRMLAQLALFAIPKPFPNYESYFLEIVNNNNENIQLMALGIIDRHPELMLKHQNHIIALLYQYADDFDDDYKFRRKALELFAIYPQIVENNFDRLIHWAMISYDNVALIKLLEIQTNMPDSILLKLVNIALEPQHVLISLYPMDKKWIECILNDDLKLSILKHLNIEKLIRLLRDTHEPILTKAIFYVCILQRRIIFFNDNNCCFYSENDLVQIQLITSQRELLSSGIHHNLQQILDVENIDDTPLTNNILHKQNSSMIRK